MSLPVARPLVYLITKGEARPDNFDEASRQILDIIRTAVDHEVPLVQLREKQLTAKLLFELTAKAVEITRGSETRLLVNDRTDVALAAEADGVHLTSRSIAPEIVRRLVPEKFLIGVSAHTEDEIVWASANGADFVLFGPIFEGPGKKDVQGLEKLSAVAQRTTVPIIAIGGINPDNAADVIATDVAGIAAIRALNDKESFREVLAAIKK